MPMEDTEPMAMEPTLTLTTDTSMERGPPMLRPSLRLMLMLTTDTTAILTDTEPMAMEPTLTLTTDTFMERGPLMPSPRLMLMLTTDTTAMVPGPTTDTVWDTDHTVWDTEDTTGDKFLSRVQSKSSKRTSLLV